MSNPADLQEKLRLGIEAARRGDREAARLLLRQVLSADPRSESAWLWLASVVDSLAERRACLQNVLKLNPNNQRAREALSRLDAAVAGRPAPPARRTPPQPAAREQAGGFSPVIAALLVVAVLALVVFLAVNVLGSASLAPVNQATAEAAINPTPTQTPDPASYTATPFFGVLVTLAPDAVNLPPTFTPTYTPTASVTPTPTATPYPLEAFSMLLVALEPGEAEPALYAAAGDGSGARLLEARISEAVYDPSGRLIAFVRPVAAASGEGEDAATVASELFVAPADNLAAARQITTLGRTVASPAWAPDGIRLAFASDVDGDFEIFTITEDGNNLRQITINEGIVDRDPVWSPDGESIVFVSDRDSPGLTRLFRMSALGDDPTPLTRIGGSSFAPRWSPNGRLIVFVNDANGDADIYTMEPNGDGVFLLTADDSGAEDRAPAFTPDSRLVVFASNRQSDVFQMYTVDLRGKTVTRLTQDDRDYQALDYRPEPRLRLLQN
ncbi:MAG: hypothetical protein ACUVSX_15110 [Aggregatilineales bacterium]